MKNFLPIPLMLVFAITAITQQPRIVGDCTLTYTVNDESNTKRNDEENTVKTIYISGKQIRIDLSSNAFNQTIIYDGNSGNAMVLKTIGASKYMSTYNENEWQNENAVYNGEKITYTNKEKKILGYNCEEANIRLKNGNNYIVYFTTEFTPMISENFFEFRSIPGTILQYEAEFNHKKIEYILKSVNFDPVPAFKFKVSTSNYKLLNGN